MSRDRETRLVYSTGGMPGWTEPEPAGPARPKGGRRVRLRLERRASGRLVTVVSGLPGAPSEVEALGRELRAACGTGGTTRGDGVELQGDQRDRVEALLSARGLRTRRAGS